MSAGEFSAPKTWLFFLLGLFGSLSDFPGAGFFEGHRFDDTDGYRLPHVTNGETTQWGEVRESLNTHGLRWNKSDNSSITRLDSLNKNKNIQYYTCVLILSLHYYYMN